MAKSQNPSGKTNVPAVSHIVSDSVGHDYFNRPTAGGNSSGQTVTGPATDAGPAVIPGPGAYTPPAPAPTNAGNTQAGPDMGWGATKLGPTGDRPSGGKDSADLGTVGDSGPQDGEKGGMPPA